MIGSLGPARRARYGLTSNSDLFDPLTNARIALDIYQQQGLRAWGPYVTGIYQKYIPASQAAYQPGASPVAPSPAPAAAVSDTTSATDAQSQDTQVSDPNADPSGSSTDGAYPGSGGDNSLVLLLGAGALALYLLTR